MTKAVLTTAAGSGYDDLPECQYHFPKTYLNQAQATVGDWVVYYEPRRAPASSGATGRQAYFAIAQLVAVEPDTKYPDHYYARMANYIAFDRPVPFREGAHYYESGLKREDGQTNKGAFRRSVRHLRDEDFAAILRAGFARDLELWERDDAVNEAPAEYASRPLTEQIVQRPFRDSAFRRHVRTAYENRCAVTGLRLINGGGRPEVQAAHIRPVHADGPDSIRNGLSLTGTIHWLFDRGLLTVDDHFNILLSPHGVPDEMDRLIPPDRQLTLPEHPEHRPHPAFLEWHREHVFKRE
ncbi:HNH endonuclease [Aquisalimonas asiatica]|uniref:Putative restriction endonuclease n=1 Tax=Aquisalimonas asiatica TaxID=406100 RepID=A0A1H8SYZ8_9GAMM|nr:HNH endonuclease [Aquisalimonas asiatica]SEO84020.1 putative restriction endonuclease [Aquisalimonas asiatica]